MTLKGTFESFACELIPTLDRYGDIFVIVEGGWSVVNQIIEECRPYMDVEPGELVHLEDILRIVFDDPGADWGFSDEYTPCICCMTAIHLYPANKPDFWPIDGEGYMCEDCVRADPEPYLEHLQNNYKAANTILCEEELQTNGWQPLPEEYECRLFSHCDCPKGILHAAQDESPDADFMFHIDSMSPFDTQYHLWQKVKL